MRNWVLPEYIEDILPPEARGIESLRARLLELFRVHGYELVMPPLLEYLESLLTGTGHDMDLRDPFAWRSCLRVAFRVLPPFRRTRSWSCSIQVRLSVPAMASAAGRRAGDSGGKGTPRVDS